MHISSASRFPSHRLYLYLDGNVAATGYKIRWANWFPSVSDISFNGIFVLGRRFKNAMIICTLYRYAYLRGFLEISDSRAVLTVEPYGQRERRWELVAV